MAELVLPRVVFAPASPGALTLTEARLALVSWLLARKAGGCLVLRLDDFAGAAHDGAARLQSDLTWLGLNADEGPERGGPFGPYNQAARHELYAHFAGKLLREQTAFYCFCGPSSGERCVSGCDRLAPPRVEELRRKGRSSVLRLRGHAGEIVVEDLIRGRVAVRAENAGDPVLVTAKGDPSPELRAAVDDALMLITHVVRDEGALLFTLRQLLICRALDWDLPHVAHLPSIRPGPQGGPAQASQLTIEALRQEGYLPGTVLGFIAHLTGMDSAGLMVDSAQELLPLFAPKGLGLEPQVLDLEVLRATSRRRLGLLRDDELRAALRPLLARSGLQEHDPRLPQLLQLFREQVATVGELAQKLSLFGKDPAPVIDRAAVMYLRRESSQKVLWSVVRQLRSLARLDEEVFTGLMDAVRREIGIMGRDLWAPVRIALTGEADGPPLPKIVALLGKDAVVKLIERSLREQA